MPARKRRLDTALLALLLVLVALVAAAAAGFRLMTIRTGSMRPTLQPGDVVVSRYEPAERLRHGDIVTFNDPGLRAMVTHRVVSVRAEGTSVLVATKGDANAVGETWRVPRSKAIAREVFRVPTLSPIVEWGAALAAVLAVGLYARRRRR